MELKKNLEEKEEEINSLKRNVKILRIQEMEVHFN